MLLKVLKYQNLVIIFPQAENISHPIAKAILKKYNNQSSNHCHQKRKKWIRFLFVRSFLTIFIKKIKRLKERKAAQSTDIPVKNLRQNADIFSAYIRDFLTKPQELANFLRF